MKFVYTTHAEIQIKDRKITKLAIENALSSPDMILSSRFGRNVVHKFTKNKLLRIVYSQKDETYIIITAYYTHPSRYKVKK